MLSKLPGASYLGEVSVFSPSKTWSEILRNDMVEGKFYKPFYKKNYRQKSPTMDSICRALRFF